MRERETREGIGATLDTRQSLDLGDATPTIPRGNTIISLKKMKKCCDAFLEYTLQLQNPISD